MFKQKKLMMMAAGWLLISSCVSTKLDVPLLHPANPSAESADAVEPGTILKPDAKVPKLKEDSVEDKDKTRHKHHHGNANGD